MSSSPDRSVVRIAANVATLLFAVVIILQLLLAAGILPVSMAWGGRQDVLTTPLRVASVVAAVILVLFGYVIRRRAGLIGAPPISTTIKILSWIITAFMILNTLGNLASVSMAEKILFGPITFVLAVSCLIVSSSRSET